MPAGGRAPPVAMIWRRSPPFEMLELGVAGDPAVVEDRRNARPDAVQLGQVIGRSGSRHRRLLGSRSRPCRLVVVLHQALPVALGRKAGLHGPCPDVRRGRHIGIVQCASQLRLVELGQRPIAGDPCRDEGSGGLGPDPNQLGQVVGPGLDRRDSRHGGGLHHRSGGLRRCRFGRLLYLELIVRDDLRAAQRFDSGRDQGLQRRGLVGRQRAVEQESVLIGDGLLDEPDRVLPAALVQDEQGALPLLDLLRDRPHELVVDPGVVDPATQAAEDAAGCAHGDGPSGSGDDRPDDHAEGADPDTGLERAAIGRLVDADPAESTTVDDRGIDDLHVVVRRVDALNRLEEPPRGVTAVDGEGRQRRMNLGVAHGSSSPWSCRIGGRGRSPGLWIATGTQWASGVPRVLSRGRGARQPTSRRRAPGRPLTDRSHTSRCTVVGRSGPAPLPDPRILFPPESEWYGVASRPGTMESG